MDPTALFQHLFQPPQIGGQMPAALPPSAAPQMPMGLPQALTPGDLGLGPRPELPSPHAPIQAPIVANDPRQKLLQFIMLGLLAGGGKGMRGAGAGLQVGQEHLQEQADAQARQQAQQQAYADEQAKAEAVRQQQAYAEEQQQRMQARQQAIGQMEGELKTAGSRDEYNGILGRYSQMFKAAGFRNHDVPSLMRNGFTYKPAKLDKVLTDALDAAIKNPANKAALANGSLAQMAIQYKDPEDGTVHQMKIADAIPLARYPAQVTPDGKFSVVGDRPMTPGEVAGEAGAFKDFTDQAKAQGMTDISARQWARDQIDKAKQKSALEIAKARAVGTNAGGGGTSDVGGLTPDGIEYAATQYRVTGVMPALGMGKTPARSQIINAAAAQARDLKQSPAVAIQKQSAYKSDASALTRMRSMSSAAEAFESKALAQADIIADLNTKVPRTQWPIVNNALLAGKANIAGDENTQLLFNALTTFTAEYAKIMEGATGSAAGSSDSARAAAQRLVNASLNPRTLQSTVELMKREMALTVQGYDATIEHITTRMGGGQPAASAAPPDVAGAPTWVRDPKTGRMVQQGAP